MFKLGLEFKVNSLCNGSPFSPVWPLRAAVEQLLRSICRAALWGGQRVLLVPVLWQSTQMHSQF